MKKTVLLFFGLLITASRAAAQDLIVCTDASRIEARVIEVAPDAVRYKRFSNPEGPIYVLPVAHIDYILYPNGDRDVFRTIPVEDAVALLPVPEATLASGMTADNEATPETPSRPAGPEAVGPDAPAAVGIVSGRSAMPDGSVLRTYALGDWYERGDVRGVVCALSEDKFHGLILSVDEIALPWSVFRKPAARAAGTTDSSDGAVNMRILERYIADNGLAWSDFPAFEWCRSKGEGWYLPSIDEMLLICANFNGGYRTGFNREARNRFNDALRGNGGHRLNRLVFYYSSTERDAKSALCTHTSQEPPYVQSIPKSDRFLVRAVHKF